MLSEVFCGIEDLCSVAARNNHV